MIYVGILTGASVNLTASSGGGYVVDSSCNGRESSFHGCQTTFEHNCSQPQDVWISCTEGKCPHYAVHCMQPGGN